MSQSVFFLRFSRFLALIMVSPFNEKGGEGMISLPHSNTYSDPFLKDISLFLIALEIYKSIIPWYSSSSFFFFTKKSNKK